MTNTEYQEIIEKKYQKSLKEVMYDLCIKQDLIPAEGARILEVPEETFKYWRNHFRFGPLQWRCDRAEEQREKRNQEYREQLQNVDILRPFKNSDRISLEGFKEYIERYIELLKAKQIINNDTGLSDTAFFLEIISFEKMQVFLEKYISGQLADDYNAEVRMISQYLADVLND